MNSSIEEKKEQRGGIRRNRKRNNNNTLIQYLFYFNIQMVIVKHLCLKSNLNLCSLDKVTVSNCEQEIVDPRDCICTVYSCCLDDIVPMSLFYQCFCGAIKSLSRDFFAMRHFNGSVDKFESWCLSTPNVLLRFWIVVMSGNAIQKSYLKYFFAGITNANQPVYRNNHLFEGEKTYRKWQHAQSM